MSILTLKLVLGILTSEMPKWRNWQTRATQTRVPSRIEGSTPSFGTDTDIKEPIPIKQDRFFLPSFPLLLSYLVFSRQGSPLRKFHCYNDLVGIGLLDSHLRREGGKMKVQNKVFVVTGGGSGMGRELVLLLLKKGARVAAVDINPDSLKETFALAGDLKDRVSSHVLDISDKVAVFALPGKVIEAHGAVDAVINNAGIIQPFVRINDLQFDAIERVLKINLYGVIYMTKAFLPYLLKRPEAHIINISSMGGFLPVPGQTIYGASKAAVKLFTEGLNSELLNSNVRVTVVFPGAVATNIGANSGVSLGDIDESEASAMPTTSADKAAEIIVDGIEKDSYRVLVGSDAKFMDFIYRLNPKRAAMFIYKQMASLLPD